MNDFKKSFDKGMPVITYVTPPRPSLQSGRQDNSAHPDQDGGASINIIGQPWLSDKKIKSEHS